MYSTYYKKRSEYYDMYLFPSSINEYFKNALKNENCFKSPEIILFKGLQFGENEKNVIRAIGKPRFVIDLSFPPLPVKTFFYKENIINSRRAIVQLHFWNDHLFFGCYTFRSWTKQDYVILTEAIANKYLKFSENHSPLDASRLFTDKKNGIVDLAGNKLMVVENVLLHVSYLWMNARIMDAMSEYHTVYGELLQLKKNEMSKVLYNKM